MNEIPSACAAIMFCGLPISVAADPVLAAKQKPKRNGVGFSPRDSVIETSSGVIATTTTSLVRRAESTPAVTTSSPSSAGGETLSVATRRATQA